jgi:hypothetical protein
MSTITTQLNSGSSGISVPEGGTGIITTTPYAPICAGTTATGNLQQAITGISNASYYLTSNGSSAVPSFQSQNISFLTMTLTASQINGMYASPIQILPAQGAHTIIVVYLMKFEYIFNTAPFSGGGLPQLCYNGSVFDQCVILFNVDLTASSSTVFCSAANSSLGIYGPGVFSPVSFAVNQNLAFTTDTGPFTGGGNSTCILTLYYDVFATIV